VNKANGLHVHLVQADKQHQELIVMW